jgi:metal-responsive CopG/Arc/MetJ family transcriptional regulator
MMNRMDESRSNERITVGLAPAVLRRLDKYAAEHRWSRSTAAAVLIEEGLRVHGEDHDQEGH